MNLTPANDLTSRHPCPAAPCSDAQQMLLRSYDDIGQMMAAVGRPDFGVAVFRFLKSALRADHVVANRVGRYAIDGLFTEGMVPARIAHTLNQRYLDRYYLLDRSLPSSWDIGKNDAVALPFDSQLNGSPAYSAFFFERVGLCDKISLISSRDDAMVCCNLYRLSASGPFSAADLKQAQSLAKLVTALVWLHAEKVVLAAGKAPALPTLAPVPATQAEVQVREDLLKSLSGREMEVCRRLLAGASNEGVALDLDISTHTVRTLRKRIYKKLQVSSLTDLFSRYLQVVSENGRQRGKPQLQRSRNIPH
ncbi:LuxR C-terminal-related transcriptional regulator [Herbaspirillum sp. NPDC087042]|uniref:helix-turn-helix transcriptional regulator n=1 Tax=Herbaspirillum sp. NPDC087042 TaxID=3364004 RepID=UPI00380ACA22